MIMKKILLFAAAAVIAVSANAQLVKKQAAGKPMAQQQVSQKATMAKKFEIAGAKAGAVAVENKLDRKAKMSLNVKDVKPVNQQFKAVRRAAEVQPTYEGYGISRSSGDSETWTMNATTVTLKDESTAVALQDIIPNPFGFDHTYALYTAQNGSVVVEPTLIASFTQEGTTYYLFLESATSNDGKITFPLDDAGHITGSYDIIYSIYPNETYNVNEWLATYDGYSNVKYNLPGEDAVPEVSFEPNNLILFAGLGLNGYSFTNNLAMTGAFATTNFYNLTSDKATAWDWKAFDATSEEETVYASGTDLDFGLNMTDGVVYGVQLTATNNTVSSDPFTFGIGKYVDEQTGAPHYEECYLYAGQTESSFILNEETPAIITRQDPDGDLTFYTNWATPDIYTKTSMSKIYCYHEKPASPLYIEGISLPMVSFNVADPAAFKLHVKICKLEWPKGRSNKPALGEVLAEADATAESINDQFDAGLTAVEFTELYKQSEDGLDEELPYLFLDDEFMIVIEGWDNGTFSGVLGCQDAPLNNARTSTWFEKTGEEGSMYAYTTWKTSLFVGLLGATYGYLNTEDDTNITIPTEGGEAAINVEAMLRSVDAESGAPTYRLFIDEVISDSELDDETGLPTWLQIGIGNVNESGTEFTIGFAADALPTGIEGRQATIVFMQEGAKLEVTVTQGKATGVNVTTKTVKTSNAAMFNLAGQRVNKNFKGLVVKDGQKFMNK